MSKKHTVYIFCLMIYNDIYSDWFNNFLDILFLTEKQVYCFNRATARAVIYYSHH